MKDFTQLEKRVEELFEELIFIHSPSKKELEMHKFLLKFLQNLGLEIYEDKHQDLYGGNSPVLFAKLEGQLAGPGVTFSAHTDVIEPNKNLKLIKEGNIWKTDGTTTLGADDKAGVAAILAMVEYLVENKIPHQTLYIIFTPSEEVGMLGARSIDWQALPESMQPAKKMLVLDKAGSTDHIAYQAPAYYKWQASILGKAAHAGIEPENGRSAILLASQIISQLPLLRIDEFTTANIGKIHTDSPLNVVPAHCQIEGELRAHDPQRAEEILTQYQTIMTDIAGEEGFKFDWFCEYPALKTPDNLAFVQEFIDIYREMGVISEPEIEGGGSDANFFAAQGFNAIILGVGMVDMHTCDEYLEVDQMKLTTQAIVNYVTQIN